jgi:hypothetical protein
VIDPIFEEQMLRGVQEATGMPLIAVPGLTNEMVTDKDRHFTSKLAGPYVIDPNANSPLAGYELRVFISYTTYTDSPRRLYVQFLVTDCEGDFLNDSTHPLNTRPQNFELA